MATITRNDCEQNALSKQVKDFAALVPGYIDEMYAAAVDAAAKIAEKDSALVRPSDVYVTGCGDSYCASMAAAPALRALLPGCTVHPVRANDLAGQIPSFMLKKGVLAMGISASGTAQRVLDGMVRAKGSGVFTIALTGNATTPLGKACDSVVALPKPEVVSPTPSVLSYAVSCLGVIFTGVGLALAAGTITKEQAKGYREDAKAYCVACGDLCQEQADDIFALAQELQDCDGFDFVGDDADFATAYFGSCKFAEGFGPFTVYDDSENWEHVNYFIKDTHHMATFAVISKSSPSLSRQLELLPVVEHLERKGVVVTDLPAESIAQKGLHIISLPEAPVSWLAPAANYLALSLLASYMTVLDGEPFFRGFAGPWGK